MADRADKEKQNLHLKIGRDGRIKCSDHFVYSWAGKKQWKSPDKRIEEETRPEH